MRTPNPRKDLGVTQKSHLQTCGLEAPAAQEEILLSGEGDTHLLLFGRLTSSPLAKDTNTWLFRYLGRKRSHGVSEAKGGLLSPESDRMTMAFERPPPPTPVL